ncbi:hypothetical protein SI65_01592 [Aspergillus cristatus]|uniref:Enoyl reductase (ER) domain-containing protein n=1 Tax=Aspergillus cristatus TaxID=573508 RepID=A0A1E3BSQ7_ASPCR|nr:hypothetical protein SI65_01592 [Aspergillus cristatus]
MSITFDVFRGSPEGRVVADTVTKTLEHNEVFIETVASGLCGTDEHFLKSNQVLGHEGVDFVRAVGPGVTSVKIGDRVGFGFTHSICSTCDNCVAVLPNVRQYGMNDFDNGSFSYGAVWDANCVFRIPDGLDFVHAAPLMCAAATVWTTLTRYGMRPADRVGIMGVGGLGHVAIKLAAALGYCVIVLSTSEMKSLLTLMDTPSNIYPLTATFELSKIPTLELRFKGIRIQGSLVASRNSIRTLLDFATKKNIAPTVRTFPLTVAGIEEAMKILREGKMRYRGVLVRNE